MSLTQKDDLVDKFKTIVYNRNTRYPLAFAELQRRIQHELRKGIPSDQKQLLLNLLSVLQQENVVEPSIAIVTKLALNYVHSLEVILG